MTKMIKVESGVPMPTSGRRASKYPFDNLSVGESFFVPDDFGISHNAVRQAVKDANVRYGGDREFVSRRVNRQSHRSGTRVWRVEPGYQAKGLRGNPFGGNDDGETTGESE